MKLRKLEYGLQVIRPAWDLSIQLLHFTEEEVTALEGYLLRVHMTWYFSVGLELLSFDSLTSLSISVNIKFLMVFE